MTKILIKVVLSKVIKFLIILIQLLFPTVKTVNDESNCLNKMSKSCTKKRIYNKFIMLRAMGNKFKKMALIQRFIPSITIFKNVQNEHIPKKRKTRKQKSNKIKKVCISIILK